MRVDSLPWLGAGNPEQFLIGLLVKIPGCHQSQIGFKISNLQLFLFQGLSCSLEYHPRDKKRKKNQS